MNIELLKCKREDNGGGGNIGRNIYHISIHIEIEADDLFIAKRKAENMIGNNISILYNPFIESIIEEVNDQNDDECK